MAGRGRGTLISEILLQESVKNSESLSSDFAGDNESNISRPSANSTDQRQSRSPLALLGLGGGHDQPLPSGGRGLMTPSHFLKLSQPGGIPKPKQSKSDDLLLLGKTQTADNTSSKSISTEAAATTQAYRNAEQYLKNLQPESSLQRSTNQNKITKPVQRSNYDHNSQGKSMPSTLSHKSQVSDASKPRNPESEQAEAEWQRFKLQRKINRILSKITKDDLNEVVNDLKETLEGNPLSEKFPQYSEWRVVLETLIEKSIESDDFIELASLITKKIAEYDIYQFQNTFPMIVSGQISEVVKVSASDNVITNATKRFCKLLGQMFIATVQDNDRFHSVVSGSIQDCIEKWTYPDGIGDEVLGFQINKAETYAYAVRELFDQISLGEFEEERVNELVPEIKRMLQLVKESVLNECLPRVVREVYLETLLLNAKWHRPDHTALDNDEKESAVGSVKDRDSRCFDGMTSGDDFSSQATLMLDSDSLSSESESHSEVQFSDKPVVSSIPKETTVLSTLNDRHVKRLSCQSEDGESQDASVIVEDEEIVNENTVEKSRDEENRILNNRQGNSYSYIADKGKEVDDNATDEDKKTGDFSSTEKQDPYHNVRIMMKNLKLENQMERFENNFIRDAVLNADREVLKGILKEAGFPAGLIYEIGVYLGENSSDKPNVPGLNTSSSGPQFSAPEFKFGDAQAKEERPGTPGEESGLAKPSSWRQKESGPKKKLLGIGRGGSNTDGSRDMRGVMSSGNAGDRMQRNERNFGRPGSDRQWNGGNSGKNREHGKKWKGKDVDREFGHQSSYHYKRDSQSSSWRSSGFDRRDNDSPSQAQNRSFDESRQIGKVQPIRKKSKEEADNAPSKALKFDGVPPGCVRCGSKNHWADNCTDSTSFFFGQ